MLDRFPVNAHKGAVAHIVEVGLVLVAIARDDCAPEETLAAEQLVEAAQKAGR
jgi:hypothetical protein